MKEGNALPVGPTNSTESPKVTCTAPRTLASTCKKVTQAGCAEAAKADLNGEKGGTLVESNERSQALSAKYVAYLGFIKDNWSSCHAAKLLDEELISYLRPRFVLLSTPLKVRVLTSLLYIKSDLVWRERRTPCYSREYFECRIQQRATRRLFGNFCRVSATAERKVQRYIERNHEGRRNRPE